jgi:hypothetical protein
LEKVKGLLNEGVENLDHQTGQRLEHIRIKALEAAREKPSGFLTPLRWVMVGGFATATMAVVALFFWLNPSSVTLPFKQVEDFEIITSQERIDFYQNLDFYRWLATEEKGPAQGKSNNA